MESQGGESPDKWFFEEGTEVEFAFDHLGERHCCAGIVVSCHPLSEPRGCFETVLYFVETPCTKLQKAASDCRLAREQKVKEDAMQFISNGRIQSPPGGLVLRTAGFHKAPSS